MTRTPALALVLLLAATVCSAILGCGGGSVGKDGDVVGGACTTEGDCAGGSGCLTASMYPGGMCTVGCATQADCPDGSTCVTESGGTCVLPCDDASDCRDGYRCTERSTPGDGHAFVCIL